MFVIVVGIEFVASLSTQNLPFYQSHIGKLRFSPVLPRAFTEYGALMLANILKSPRAVNTSVQIIRAFIRLRQMLLSHEAPARKLMLLEENYDGQFKIVFESIKRLLLPQQLRRRSLQ
jgi:hypothetical protein